MSFLNQVNRVVWAIVIRGIAKDPEDYCWVRVIYCNQDFISRTICHFLQCVVNPRWCYPADSNYSVMAPIVHKSHIHLIVSPITGRFSGCREACRYLAPPPPPGIGAGGREEWESPDSVKSLIDSSLSVKSLGNIIHGFIYTVSGLPSWFLHFWYLGDLVEFRGPCGGFEYESNSVKHISLVTSGSGATPCIQIVRDIMADPGDQTSVSMLYSAETESEFRFKSELDDHSACDERFRVFYTLSKGAGQETWQGGEGHIDKDMISNHLIGPQVLEHKVLLCGGPTMIVSVMRILFQMGYSSHQIFVYGPFGAELVRAVFGRNARLSSHRFER